jgi:hypothetical protein
LMKESPRIPVPPVTMITLPFSENSSIFLVVGC